MKHVSRRVFLRLSAALGAGALAGSCSRPPEPTPPSTEPPPTEPSATQMPAPTAVAPTTAAPEPHRPPTITPAPTAAPAYLAVARGADPAAITERAIAALGGIERFCRPGANVIIKPNICNASHTFEYASTTNPVVVATLVRLCLGAGAGRVRVMDAPFSGTPQAAYARSGIEEAVLAAGGEMELMAQMGYAEVEIPDGRDLSRWRFYQPILEADLLINVPIAKHHNLARLTLGGKNLMGAIADRGQMHRNLHQRIADIATVLRPALTVVDCVRILHRNGPTGGRLEDVEETNAVIASADLVAADAYACSLFGVAPEEIGYIAAGAEMGLGTMDLGGVRVEELHV